MGREQVQNVGAFAGGVVFCSGFEGGVEIGGQEELELDVSGAAGCAGAAELLLTGDAAGGATAGAFGGFFGEVFGEIGHGWPQLSCGIRKCPAAGGEPHVCQSFHVFRRAIVGRWGVEGIWKGVGRIGEE